MADEGIKWGEVIGNTLKTVATGAAVVAGISLLPEGLQLVSDGLESLSGNATQGVLVSASNGLESAAQSLSSHYVDFINWTGQYLGTGINPDQILNAANVTAPAGQTAAETVFTNWDSYKAFADVTTQNAGDALNGLWSYAQNNPLAVGTAVGAGGLVAYEAGKTNPQKPTVGAHTAAYNAREAARARLAALQHAQMTRT